MAHRLLALDTTTEACSVAAGEEAAAASCWQQLRQGQSREIIPMIDAVLAELGWARSSIDAIACCRGPGSFTGVRISTGVAQGLALGLDRPVIPVSTLATLAEGAFAAHAADRVIPAIDARKGEVYWAAFRPSPVAPEPVLPEAVTKPEAVALPADTDGWVAVGTGFAAYPEALTARLRGVVSHDVAALPDARHLWRIACRLAARGDLAQPADAVAVYLRDQVADPPRTSP